MKSLFKHVGSTGKFSERKNIPKEAKECAESSELRQVFCAVLSNQCFLDQAFRFDFSCLISESDRISCVDMILPWRWLEHWPPRVVAKDRQAKFDSAPAEA